MFAHSRETPSPPFTGLSTGLSAEVETYESSSPPMLTRARKRAYAAKMSMEKTITQTISTVSDTIDVPKTTEVEVIEWSSGSIYVGGFWFMLIHFAMINTRVISNLSMNATGTVTITSWFLGWLFIFHRSIKDLPVGKKAPLSVRVEFLLLMTQLFCLFVGAGAFSRYYSGWVAGRSHDLFQELSIVYLNQIESIPER